MLRLYQNKISLGNPGTAMTLPEQVTGDSAATINLQPAFEEVNSFFRN
ncbi:MAG: hypothetical protein ONB42_23225 [candidate division KSB1 bacterium]|nr:hypothetical protein [candidate division KSB1 bacterium]